MPGTDSPTARDGGTDPTPLDLLSNVAGNQPDTPRRSRPSHKSELETTSEQPDRSLAESQHEELQGHTVDISDPPQESSRQHLNNCNRAIDNRHTRAPHLTHPHIPAHPHIAPQVAVMYPSTWAAHPSSQTFIAHAAHAHAHAQVHSGMHRAHMLAPQMYPPPNSVFYPHSNPYADPQHMYMTQYGFHPHFSQAAVAPGYGDAFVAYEQQRAAVAASAAAASASAAAGAAAPAASALGMSGHLHGSDMRRTGPLQADGGVAEADARDLPRKGPDHLHEYRRPRRDSPLNASRLQQQQPPAAAPSQAQHRTQHSLHGVAGNNVSRPTRRKSYTRFTAEEEHALMEGVRIHGVGNWKQILASSDLLSSRRSTIQLKDKYRTATRARQRLAATAEATGAIDAADPSIGSAIGSGSGSGSEKARSEDALKKSPTGAAAAITSAVLKGRCASAAGASCRAQPSSPPDNDLLGFETATGDRVAHTASTPTTSSDDDDTQRPDMKLSR